jgi:hypothetical protein
VLYSAITWVLNASTTTVNARTRFTSRNGSFVGTDPLDQPVG